MYIFASATIQTGCRDAPREKLWKEGITIKDTSTIMHIPFALIM